MAAPQTNLSAADAQAAAFAALDQAATTKVTIEKQSDGTWTVTVLP
jgi:hypothetical protein